MSDVSEAPFRSGYVALLGRPNVGKSTLLNQLIGHKIAATTHKPQTTRKNLLGVLHTERAQILVLDTPGYHQAKGPLNKYMVGEARTALRDADVVGYLVEHRSDANITPGNERLISELKRAKKPVVLIINKIDTLKDRSQLLPFIETYRVALGELLADVVPISALKKKGLDSLLKAIVSHLPEGPAYYEEGQITDKSERAIAAEMVREKVMLETRDELPYSAAVTIEGFDDERPKIVRIAATIHVERDSQKGIVIGKGGLVLRRVGQAARAQLPPGAFLELHVTVEKDWQRRPDRVRRMGY